MPVSYALVLVEVRIGVVVLAVNCFMCVEQVLTP